MLRLIVAAAVALSSATAAADPEVDRIQSHLERVERALRAAPTDHLSASQRARRARALDRLRAYRLRGVFPKNTYAPGRVPVFVDAAGTRCAVGAIAEPDVGREVIEGIAATQRLARVPDIDSPELSRWAIATGFAIDELARIQPNYDDGGSVEVPRDPQHVNQAQRLLDADWRHCRDELYPQSVGRGEQKIGAIVSFRRAGKRARVAVKLELVAPAVDPALWRRFERCVTRRFNKRSVWVGSDRGRLGRVGLTNPGWGAEVVDTRGGLNVAAAAEYVRHKLEAIGRRCKARPKRVTVEVAADASFTADADDECVRRALGRRLKFPASKKGGTVRAL